MPRAEGFYYLTYLIDLKTPVVVAAHIDKKVLEFGGACTTEILAVKFKVGRLALRTREAWEDVLIDV